jgi:hypothetical protein
MSEPPWQGCEVPPDGWWCSREPGHEGPCAARAGRRTRTELIPAGDSGERRITRRDLSMLPSRVAAQVEGVLLAEAAARGLEVNFFHEFPSGDIIVRWRPAQVPEGGE